MILIHRDQTLAIHWSTSVHFITHYSQNKQYYLICTSCDLSFSICMTWKSSFLDKKQRVERRKCPSMDSHYPLYPALERQIRHSKILAIKQLLHNRPLEQGTKCSKQPASGVGAYQCARVCVFVHGHGYKCMSMYDRYVCSYLWTQLDIRKHFQLSKLIFPIRKSDAGQHMNVCHYRRHWETVHHPQNRVPPLTIHADAVQRGMVWTIISRCRHTYTLFLFSFFPAQYKRNITTPIKNIH